MSPVFSAVKKVVGGVAKAVGSAVKGVIGLISPSTPKATAVSGIQQEIAAVDTKIDKEKADRAANLANIATRRGGAAANILAGELEDEAETAKRKLLGSSV